MEQITPASLDRENVLGLFDGFPNISGISPSSMSVTMDMSTSPMSIVGSPLTILDSEDEDECTWGPNLLLEYRAAKLEPAGYENHFYSFFSSLLWELFPDGKYTINPQGAGLLGCPGAIDFTVTRLSMTVEEELVKLNKLVVFFVEVKEEESNKSIRQSADTQMCQRFIALWPRRPPKFKRLYGVSCFGGAMRLYWAEQNNGCIKVYPEAVPYYTDNDNTIVDNYLTDAWNIDILSFDGRHKLDGICAEIHKQLQDIILQTEKTIEWEKQRK